MTMQSAGPPFHLLLYSLRRNQWRISLLRSWLIWSLLPARSLPQLITPLLAILTLPYSSPCPLASLSPLLPDLTTNVSQLAEAASKISLLSPGQFQLPPSLSSRPDLVGEENIILITFSPPANRMEFSPSPVPQLEIVHTVSGNSSPSSEVADILEEVGQFREEQVEDDEGEEDSPTADRTFQDTESTPSPTSVKLSHSAMFPTPPAVPQQVTAIPTEMDNMGVAMMIRQMQQDKENQDVDMASMETRLEGSMMMRMGQMEQRLGELAKRGNKEQTDRLVSALTSSVSKKMER